MVFRFFKKEDKEQQTHSTSLTHIFQPEGIAQTDAKLVQIIAHLDECKSNDFNYLVEKLVQRLGFDTQIIDGIHDSGIDIIGFQQQKKVLAVQCKAWNPKRNTNPLDKKEVLAFKGKTMSDGYEKSLFVTTHYFTKPALDEASDNFFLIDRRILHDLLATYFPKEFSEAFYYETLKELKACPTCQKGKLIRLYSKNKRTYYTLCERCQGYHPCS